MKKRTIVICAAIGLPAAIVALLGIRDRQLRSSFGLIATGASQAAVIADLGEPHAVEQCGAFGGAVPAGCVKELSYISALTFWDDVWTVSFDASDRVVRKYHYRSP